MPQKVKELNTTRPTSKDRMRRFPEFKEGMGLEEIADLEWAVGKLLQLAEGYEVEEVKTTWKRVVVDKVFLGKDGRGRNAYFPIYGLQIVRQKIIRKRVPPNLRARKFFLTHMDSLAWRRSDPKPAPKVRTIKGIDDLTPEEQEVLYRDLENRIRGAKQEVDEKG